LHILNRGSEPTAVAEANTQQAFVDILDDDVIKPLAMLKASHRKLLGSAEIPVLITASSERKRKIRQESGLRKISGNPPRNMPTVQGTQS